MKKISHLIAEVSVLAVYLCARFSSVEASEVFSSADVMESGAWALSAYGRSGEVEPVVKLSGLDAIQVPTSGGASTVFANSNTEATMEQRASEITAAAAFRPREGFTYKLKIGHVRDFELEFSSGSQSNKLEATQEGFVWGCAVGGSIAPGSIVSTAISWEIGFTQKFLDLDRLQGGSIVYAVDQNLRQEEYQAVVSFSRRWISIEPFAGVKLMRINTQLRDNVTKARVRGNMDGISPYVGLQWAVTDRENLVVEGSFAAEKSLTAGFKVQF